MSPEARAHGLRLDAVPGPGGIDLYRAAVASAPSSGPAAWNRNAGSAFRTNGPMRESIQLTATTRRIGPRTIPSIRCVGSAAANRGVLSSRSDGKCPNRKNPKLETRNPKQIQNPKGQRFETFMISFFRSVSNYVFLFWKFTSAVVSAAVRSGNRPDCRQAYRTCRPVPHRAPSLAETSGRSSRPE